MSYIKELYETPSFCDLMDVPCNRQQGVLEVTSYTEWLVNEIKIIDFEDLTKHLFHDNMLIFK